MGTLTNITDEDLDPSALRCTVPAGESVEVDDALLTDPGLVWPAAVWEVNGASHEHDPNTPENLAKAAAERLVAEQAAAEAAAEAEQAVESVPLPAVAEPIQADPAANPIPAPPASEEK